MSREFFDSRFSPETMEDQVVLEAFKEAKEKSDRERIEPPDFKDLYSEEAVQEDMRLAAELERKFEESDDRESNKLALILEEIFLNK